MALPIGWESEMNEPIDLDGLTMAARRREFDDGLMDLAVAVSFLCLSLFAWMALSPGAMSWYANALAGHRFLVILGLALLAIVMIAVPYLVGRMMDRLRRLLIWRERGYIQPLRGVVSWPPLLLATLAEIGLVVAAYWLMALGGIGTGILLLTVVASSGLGMGIVFYGLGRAMGIRRYLAVGMTGGILSLGIPLMAVSFSMAWLILGVLWATLLCVSGGWALHFALTARKASPVG
jgi:hypothetical protein